MGSRTASPSVAHRRELDPTRAAEGQQKAACDGLGGVGGKLAVGLVGRLKVLTQVCRRLVVREGAAHEAGEALRNELGRGKGRVPTLVWPVGHTGPHGPRPSPDP
jgi:hypothetical protein